MARNCSGMMPVYQVIQQGVMPWDNDQQVNFIFIDEVINARFG